MVFISDDHNTALFNMLVEYFAQVNMSYNSAHDTALLTGLTNELAEDLVDNYTQLQTRDYRCTTGSIWTYKS